MTAQRKKPFLAVVDGEGVPPPARIPTTRRPRKTAADREAAAIAAGETIARLLPAYVEVHRVWAAGTKEAGEYRDANVSEAERYELRGPVTTIADAMREASGADAAQRAMSALNRDIAPLARIIAAAPAETLAGLRAKTLAAMWECMPGIADHVGFDFGDAGPVLEMLFRVNIRSTGLLELAATLEARLGKNGKA